MKTRKYFILKDCLFRIYYEDHEPIKADYLRAGNDYFIADNEMIELVLNHEDTAEATELEYRRLLKDLDYGGR